MIARCNTRVVIRFGSADVLRTQDRADQASSMIHLYDANSARLVMLALA